MTQLYYIRLKVRFWTDALQLAGPLEGCPLTVERPAGDVGFLEVFDSLAAFEKAYPGEPHAVVAAVAADESEVPA